MYSAEIIHHALLASQNINPDQQKAISLLNEWSQLPESIITSLEIMKFSESEYVNMNCASLMMRKIPSEWSHLNEEMRNNFKIDLLNFVMNFETGNKVLKTFINLSLVYVALYEWPENWEEFNQVLFPTQDSFLLKKLFVIRNFFKYLHINGNITEKRRTFLINIFVDRSPQIMEMITQCIEQPQFVHQALCIYRFILLWAPMEQVVSFELFHKIAFILLPTEENYMVCLKCLTSIFISRSDSAVAFRMYSPLLAKSLSTSHFPNQTPISLSIDVVNFAIRFLYIYTSCFELIFIKDKPNIDFPVSDLIDDSVIGLVETMKSKGMSPDELKNDLINLYQVILSIPVEEITDIFWQLWFDNLRRILFEKKHQLNVMPSFEFFQPLLGNILNSLYNGLVSAVSEDGVCSYHVIGCLTTLYNIDQTHFLEFIKLQPPSPQLCYSLGILGTIIKVTPSIRSLSQVVIELLEFSKSCNDQRFTVAFLYGLSHSLFFLNENKDLFNDFFDFLIRCFNEANNNDIASAAANALNYLIQKNVQLHGILTESNHFIEQIVEQSESYIMNLDSPTAIKIFESCSYLISKSYSTSTAKAFYANLFEPVVQIISSFSDKIETALLIIKECSFSEAYAVTKFYNIVWPSLKNLMEYVLNNTSYSNYHISLVLQAVASLQVNFPDDSIQSQISEIINMMASRGQIEESFFEYFTILKSNINCFFVEELFPAIFEKLVLPTLNNKSTDIPYAPIINLLSEFQDQLTDLDWMISLLIDTLTDLRKEVYESALNALQKILYTFDNEQIIDFTNKRGSQVTNILVEMITDTLHKKSFTTCVDFLRVFVQLNLKEQEKMKIMVCHSLQKACIEPHEGFFNSFVNYIFSIGFNFEAYKEAFVNLLIILRMATPGDIEIFQVEPVHQNLKIKNLIEQEL